MVIIGVKADIITCKRYNNGKEICLIGNIEDFITASEAAKLSGYSIDYIARLCREGILFGAQMKGKMWLIPKQSIENYEPALRGFAAVQSKRRAEAEKALKEQNAAIRAAKGLPADEPSVSEEPIEYVDVEEAAKILNRSKRTVRGYCLSRRIAGATRKDARGREWLIPKASLKNILPSIGVIRSDGTVMPLGRGKDAEV